MFVRYETPNKDGLTRRERNEAANEYTPEFSIPEHGKYLWDIYHNISESVSRTVEGYYRLIPPSEYEAWFRLTGTLVYSCEYDILVAMDREYCLEANKELDDIRSRAQEEQMREIEKNKRRR